MEFSPLSFFGSEEAFEPQYPFALEWSSVASVGLPELDDGDFYEVLDDFISSSSPAVEEAPLPAAKKRKLTGRPAKRDPCDFPSFEAYKNDSKSRKVATKRIWDELVWNKECRDIEPTLSTINVVLKPGGRLPDFMTVTGITEYKAKKGRARGDIKTTEDIKRAQKDWLAKHPQWGVILSERFRAKGMTEDDIDRWIRYFEQLV